MEEESEMADKDWRKEAMELREEIRQLKEAVRMLQQQPPATAGKPGRAARKAARLAVDASATVATAVPAEPTSEAVVKEDVKEMVKRAFLALRGPPTTDTGAPEASAQNWQSRLKVRAALQFIYCFLFYLFKKFKFNKLNAWCGGEQKLMRQDDVDWADRLLASSVAKRLPSEKDWNRLLEQTKNLSKEVKDVKVKQWLADRKAVTWLQTKLDKLNTVNPKAEWEQVLARLKAIPPGILSLDPARLQQQSAANDGEAQVNRRQLEWIAKVAARMAKNQAKPKVLSKLL
jgi:hypothetical protein